MSIKIKYQDQNLNKGTDKGRDMVQRSIDKFGMRDAVVIDKNGEIISGNHRKKAATKKGITKERIIEATSDEVIAIQYKDVDLSTPEGKELALALNQTAKFNINIDEEVAIEELGEVVEEWGIVGDAGVGNGEDGDYFSGTDGITAKNQFGVIVICDSEGVQESVYKDLTGMGFNCKIVVT